MHLNQDRQSHIAFRVPYTGVSGIAAWRLDPTSSDISVVIRPAAKGNWAGDTPARTLAIEQEWTRQTAANPRLYDGPVLSVVSFDPQDNQVVAEHDSYKRLCVQPRVKTGVRLLAVTALLIARDNSGDQHVLMGKRGGSTRLYADKWEVGPSGGVSVTAVSVLTFTDLCRTLYDEIEEELGEGATHTIQRAGKAVAYVRDEEACSDDIIIEFRLPSLDNVAHFSQTSNWEYSEVRWIPLTQLREWDNDNTIAATRATLRVLGYISTETQ